MAVGDISAVGLGNGVVGAPASTSSVSTLSPTPATTPSPTPLTADVNPTPTTAGTDMVRLNGLVQALNRLASSSSLLQPATATGAERSAAALQDRMVQLNVMVAAIDVNVPLSQQPMADAIAGLLIDLLNDLNQQRNDATGNQGTSPIVQLILAQALLQPSGTFVNTTA